jgi:Protein of unknown function (DUF2721)
MPTEVLTQNPFAVLSLVAAPALLTNATSVLALSTINRILRSGDRMRALSTQLEAKENPEYKRVFLLAQVNRVEKQALMLLRALHSIYVALGCFASASLISIVGAGLAQSPFTVLSRVMVALGLAAGFIGAGGLVWGSTNLLHATRLSLQNISEEAALIRKREELNATAGTITPPS